MTRIFSFLFAALFAMVASARTYVVSVGISKYKSISRLYHPEDDAYAISRLYQANGAYVTTLTGMSATRSNILQALQSQFSRAQADDMVVFFFSGHGYDRGFCPYDMAGMSSANGLSYNDIYAAFRNTRARHKVVLADACLSGGMRKRKTSASAGSPQKKSDVVMFLSSRTSENSIERTDMSNGFFTTYLDAGLRGKSDANGDRIVTAREIFNYVSKGVKQLSSNRQHPVMWGRFSDNFPMMDWRK